MLPRLAVLLGTEAGTVDRPEQWAQHGQGGGGRVGPLAELGAQAPGQHAVDIAHDDSVGEALEHLERPRGALVDALTAQHDDVTLSGVQRQLVEEPGLARARVGLDQHQALEGVVVVVEDGHQLGQLFAPPYEGRLGQHLPAVAPPGGDGRLVQAGLQGGGDLGQVTEDGGGRLIAPPRVLGQQAVQDPVE